VAVPGDTLASIRRLAAFGGPSATSLTDLSCRAGVNNGRPQALTTSRPTLAAGARGSRRRPRWPPVQAGIAPTVSRVEVLLDAEPFRSPPARRMATRVAMLATLSTFSLEEPEHDCSPEHVVLGAGGRKSASTCWSPSFSWVQAICARRGRREVVRTRVEPWKWAPAGSRVEPGSVTIHHRVVALLDVLPVEVPGQPGERSCGRRPRRPPRRTAGAR